MSIPNPYEACVGFVSASPEVRITKSVSTVLVTYAINGFDTVLSGSQKVHVDLEDESDDCENGKIHWDSLSPESDPETGEYLYEGSDGRDYRTSEISVSDGRGGSVPLFDGSSSRAPADPPAS